LVREHAIKERAGILVAIIKIIAWMPSEHIIRIFSTQNLGPVCIKTIRNPPTRELSPYSISPFHNSMYQVSTPQANSSSHLFSFWMNSKLSSGNASSMSTGEAAFFFCAALGAVLGVAFFFFLDGVSSSSSSEEAGLPLFLLGVLLGVVAGVEVSPIAC
jgi:hypothetical protein